jgi:hypothetical protein
MGMLRASMEFLYVCVAYGFDNLVSVNGDIFRKYMLSQHTSAIADCIRPHY